MLLVRPGVYRRPGVRRRERPTDARSTSCSPCSPTRPGEPCWNSLVHDGPQTATELAAHFPSTRQPVVKHLRVLADAGLVDA